jgi:flagellar basal body-associated protein FliL
MEGSTAVNGTETAAPPKKGMNWLPIIIIAAIVGALLIGGLLYLFIRKRRSPGYKQTAKNEGEAARSPPAK